MSTRELTDAPTAYHVGPSSDDAHAWHLARSSVLSATQISDIASGSEAAFRSLYKKRRGGDAFAGNRYTEFGNSYELWIAGYALGKWGYVHNKNLMLSKAYPWAGATPDIISVNGDTVLDAKTKHIGGGKPRITKAPRKYADQVTWQGIVTGARTLGLLVLHWSGDEGDPPQLHDDEPALIEIPWDEERAEHLLAVGERYIEFEDEEDIINSYQ